MSHIVSITAEIRDQEAARAACQRLGLPQPVHQTVRLFSGAATGLCVQLPDWRYPLVCDLTSGQVQFDNFGGHWGDQQQFDRFLQAYAVEKATLEARRQGHSLVEQPLADGSIKLVIQVAGGAA